MSSSATEITRQDFFSTPIWSTNLSQNNRKERQVSVNDDMITFIKSEIEKNPEIKTKSNQGGGWQSHTELFNEPVFKEFGNDIWNICKIIFPHINGMRIGQMWAAINFEGSYNITHGHGTQYDMSGAYYLQVPENSGEIGFRDPRPAAVNHYFTTWHIEKGEYKWFMPRESDFMLFPPFVDHCVLPSKSKDPRIMISFDLKFT